MLIALANPEGDFTATLCAPNEGDGSFASLSDPEAVLLFFKQEFADLVPMVPGPRRAILRESCWPACHDAMQWLVCARQGGAPR